MKSRVAIIVGVVALCVTGITPSFAQQPIARRQSTAFSLQVANIVGRPGQTVPLNISVTGATQNLRALVMVRGVPSQFKLSSGFQSGDSWLVSRSELKTLRLAVPNDFEGRFDIEVSFVQVESDRRQTRSASVTIERGRQPEARILVLEQGGQAQTRSISGIAPPKRRPTAVIRHKKSITTTALGTAAAPAATILCEGVAQVQSDGTRIVTPYCQDGYIADVARNYGVRTSAREIRDNLAEKARVCQFIGDDIRARSACATYGYEGTRRR